MKWVRFGRGVRAIRLRAGMRQADVRASASVSRSVVSLLERGQGARLAVGTLEAVVAAVGARFEARLSWNGPELDRLLDAGHAALAAAVKQRLERWQLQPVRRARQDRSPGLASTHDNVVGDRGEDRPRRRPGVAWSMDIKTQLATHVAVQFGWQVRRVVPGIVFLEDRTTRRKLDEMAGLSTDMLCADGQPSAGCDSLRQQARRGRPGSWFMKLPNARVVLIGGQRVRRSRPRASR